MGDNFRRRNRFSRAVTLFIPEGVTSARWISSLNSKQWVAVTASPQMKNQVSSKMKKKMRTTDHILLGTWSSDQLLSEVLNITNGNKFDVVIADYLVGLNKHSSIV